MIYEFHLKCSFFCTEITYLLGSGQIATSIASLSQLFMGCTFSPSLGISAQKCGHRGSEIDIFVKVYKWKPSVALTNKMAFRSQSRKIPTSASLGLCGEQYWFPYWHDFMPLLRHTTLIWSYQERSFMICPFQCSSNFHLPRVAVRGEAGGPQDTGSREECFGILGWSGLDLPVSEALQVIKRIWGSPWLRQVQEAYS